MIGQHLPRDFRSAGPEITCRIETAGSEFASEEILTHAAAKHVDPAHSTHLIPWIGIGFCLINSGLFSGLNLALLGVSRLQLEVEAKSGDRASRKILDLREDSHFLLATILWGNVSANCLLTIISDSILFGVSAFFFSTVGITVVGEILPQAYFSRNALRVGARLAPFIRLYQFLLYPVAKPTGKLLDYWLGSEEVSYFAERELREIIRQHMIAEDADLDQREGLGALNFLTMDDLPVRNEGEAIDPKSIIELPNALNLPVFPPIEPTADNPFLQEVQASGKKWIIIVDDENKPQLCLDADGFLRAAIFATAPINPYVFCHRPLVVTDGTVPLGTLIRQLRVVPENRDDDVIDDDLILLWGDEKRILTGADLLGRLLRGIVTRRPALRGKRTSGGLESQTPH